MTTSQCEGFEARWVGRERERGGGRSACVRGISGRRVEKNIRAGRCAYNVFFYFSIRDMAPTIHQLTCRPKVHTMAVSCAAATSVDHTRKMGREGEEREEGVRYIVCMRFFLWKGEEREEGFKFGQGEVWEGEKCVRGRDVVCMRALVEFEVWGKEGGQVLEVLKFGKGKGKGGNGKKGRGLKIDQH